MSHDAMFSNPKSRHLKNLTPDFLKARSFLDDQIHSYHP